MELPVKCDVSQSTNEVIKELALPASTQIGQALGNVFGLINTATLLFKFTNEWAQRNFRTYSEKLNEIPKEQIKQVDPEIAIPLIEKLSYTSNEDLANAYANLLANASNKEKVDLIHPGFIQKLNNLSPDEARLLEYLKNNLDDAICYIIFKGKNSTDNSFIYLSVAFTGIEQILNLSAKQMAIHFENLVSLSILRDHAGSHKVDENGYKKLIDLYSKQKGFCETKLEAKDLNFNKLEIEKSYYSITSLGRVFIEACTSETKNKTNLSF